MTVEQDKISDIRPVYLDELTEIPRELSGTLKLVTLCDSDGWDKFVEFAVINPTFVDSEGRRRELDTRGEKKYFFKKDDPDNSALIGNRWVALELLMERLEEFCGENPIEINLHF